MSTVLPVQSGTNVQATGTGGAHVVQASNGRINVISGATGSFKIYSAFSTDTEFTETTSIATADAGNSWPNMWSVSGDYLHLIWSRACRSTISSSTDKVYYRRINLTNGTVENAYLHEFFHSDIAQTIYGIGIHAFSNGSAVVCFTQYAAYRSMGSNYTASAFLHIASNGTVTSQPITPGTLSNYTSSQQFYFNDTVYGLGSDVTGEMTSAAAYSDTTNTFVPALYCGKNGSTNSHWLPSGSFYDATNGRQYVLIDGNELSEYQEGYWTYNSGLGRIESTTMTFASLGSKPVLGYNVDVSTSTRRIAYIDNNTVTVYENDGTGWDGFVSYQNSSFASQKANLPVGIYDTGSALRGCAVFGNDSEGYEIAFDIELVSIGSVAADIDIAVGQTISQTIAATLEHGGDSLNVTLAQAVGQAISGSLTSLPLDLQQGFESRYQANEPGALLERNIYRAYVGATEFPLYSISASFSGLDAFTGDPSGSAYITLKAPMSQRDYLTSQVGQEFIVLNGVETAGVFQGVEFVRGIIDEVKAVGDFVVVSTSRTEQFSAGVEVTIDTGIEFVSRQRIRFGRINPTLRPGARLITPRGTYDIAQLTYFVGPRQKFMEISAYG